MSKVVPKYFRKSITVNWNPNVQVIDNITNFLNEEILPYYHLGDVDHCRQMRDIIVNYIKSQYPFITDVDVKFGFDGNGQPVTFQKTHGMAIVFKYPDCLVHTFIIVKTSYVEDRPC